MQQVNERPKVGIGIIVVKEDKILVGKRIANFGAQTWMIPGGHLEFGETFEECAKRETAEESGLTDIEVQNIISISNDIEYGKHYISIVLLAKWKSGKPFAAEPEKSEDWQWIDPHHLPQPFFPHSEKAIKNWLAGKIY